MMWTKLYTAVALLGMVSSAVAGSIQQVHYNCGAEKGCGSAPACHAPMCCKPVICRPECPTVCTYQRQCCKPGCGSLPYNGCCGQRGGRLRGLFAPKLCNTGCGTGCGPSACGKNCGPCGKPVDPCCRPVDPGCAAPCAPKCVPPCAKICDPGCAAPCAPKCAPPCAKICDPGCAAPCGPAACGKHCPAPACGKHCPAPCGPAMCGQAPACGAPKFGYRCEPVCCNYDPCEVANLIYTSQTACYAKCRAKALDRLGDRYDCRCSPEIMCAFIYGLNDADERVRWEAANSIRQQLKRHSCCCSDQVIAALANALGDCDRKVRREAEKALCLCGYDVVDCNYFARNCTTGCGAANGPACGVAHRPASTAVVTAPVNTNTVPATTKTETAPVPPPTVSTPSTATEPEAYFPSKKTQSRARTGLSNLFGLAN